MTFITEDAARAADGHLELWRRFCGSRWSSPELEATLDVSRVRSVSPDPAAPPSASPGPAAPPSASSGPAAPPKAGAADAPLAVALARALTAMAALENGALANGDEGRMVGHYWLRAPSLAPSADIRTAIIEAQADVQTLAGAVRDGRLSGQDGPFRNVIHVGIGGSALGPQLLADALGGEDERFRAFFLDNADPDGMASILRRLPGGLGRTLVSVVSKSGITPTPHQVLTELEAAYRQGGLDFPRHAVATTMAGSELDRYAVSQGWLARLPLWDWVGGRTSVTSPVGLFPAALLGVDVAAFLDGAATMDRLTREPEIARNPAAVLAQAWYVLGEGRGSKQMVVLPYADALALLPRYLQQLIMESLGKRLDRREMPVHQGLTVYGHKGCTDQHSYFQQVRDGRRDIFVTFIRVHRPRHVRPAAPGSSPALADHLFGNLEGTRDALLAASRDSITVSIGEVSPRCLGALIALFERAVGLYAELIDVNAYHQPGVDKHAAARAIALQGTVLGYLRTAASPKTAEEVAQAIAAPGQVELVFTILEHLAISGARGVQMRNWADPENTLFWLATPAAAGQETAHEDG
jgi:glucose-6-phosphate isomerase